MDNQDQQIKNISQFQNTNQEVEDSNNLNHLIENSNKKSSTENLQIELGQPQNNNDVYNQMYKQGSVKIVGLNEVTGQQKFKLNEQVPNAQFVNIDQPMREVNTTENVKPQEQQIQPAAGALPLQANARFTAEQLQRIEERKQREREIVLEDPSQDHEMMQARIKKAKSEYCQGALIGIIFIIAFVVRISIYKDQYDLLRILYPPINLFIWLNIGAYVVHVVWSTFAFFAIRPSTFKILQCVDLILILTIIAIGIYGAVQLYSSQLQSILDKYPQDYFYQIISVVTAMVWLRLIVLIFIGCIVGCACCIIGCVIGRGGAQSFRSAIQQHQQHIAKVPIINNFIDQKARTYDESKGDAEVGQCAICMEDFKDHQELKVAVLNCSSKHIFHVECLKQWVTQNTTCPNCREEIKIE